MTEPLVQVLLVLLLVGGLASVPFGVPGVWLMIAVLLGGVLAGWVTWPVWGVLAILALASEGLEFVLLKTLGERYGGTPAAFWAAVAGGIVGVLVGVPVPVIGPLLAGLLGTFAGAALVTLHRTRSLRGAARVGWGVLLGRILAVGLKVGVGVAVLVVGGSALLFFD